MARPTLTERCFAVCVGVNEHHPDAGLSALRYAENDAQAVDKLLGELGTPPERRRLLCGAEATLDNINDALDELFINSHPGKNDLLFFYYAGHGVPVSFSDSETTEVFLASWDFNRDQLQKKSFRLKQSLSLQRLRRDYFEGGGSRKRLFIFDSCYSGDFLGPGYRDDGVELVRSEMRHLLPGDATGRVALASCLPTQQAREDETLGHGRMTYYLLRALRGDDPGAREPDGWVTVQSLHSYLARKLEPSQHPVLSGQFTRMPLVRFDPPAQPPPPSPLDPGAYLQRVIDFNRQIDLRGLGGPVEKLPLERVYAALKADAAPPAERRAAARYVQQQMLTLPLDTLDPYHAQTLLRRTLARSDPIALSLLRQFDEGDARLLPGGRPARLNLGELLARERWAVLLGDPGAGKTTLVRWAALTFARALQAGRGRVVVPAAQVHADTDDPDEMPDVDLGPARLPVLLRLADYEAARWQDGRDTSLTIAGYLGRQPWLGQPLFTDATSGGELLRRAINEGRALILCDGLDEITDQNRRGQVVDALIAFIREHVRDPQSNACPADEERATGGIAATPPVERGGNQIIITSRIVGYYLAPLPAAMPHYTVAELSDAAIRRFCAAWGAAVAEQTGDATLPERVKALAQALVDRQRPDLRELAGNPLLLTALAAQYGAAPGELPRRRIEVYDRVADAFLKQRPEALKAAGINSRKLRYALAQVALRLHADPDHPAGFVAQDELHEWLTGALQAIADKPEKRRRARIDAAAIIAYVRESGGLFMERGEGIYAFLHRSFQEYFAALALGWDGEKAVQDIITRLDDPARHEVLILAVANLSRTKQRLATLMRALIQAPEPAPGLLPRNALFIARCAGELIHPPPEDVTAEAAAQLAAACAPRAWTPRESDDAPEPLRKAAATALRQLWSLPGAVRSVSRMLAAADPAQRFAAADLLLEQEWTHPDLAPAQIAAARDHLEPAVVMLAAIEEHAEAHPDAFTPALLPLRGWLRGGEGGIDPAWRMLIRAVYTPAWRAPDAPLSADEILLDSPLTPLLEPLWRRRADRADLIAALEAHRAEAADPALVRDLALALSVLANDDWSDLLAPVRRAVAVRIGWRWLKTTLRLVEKLALARARALDLARDLALALDLALDLDLARVLARALDRARALDLALDRALDRALARDLARARDLALARALDRALARARALALDRALALALARARARALALALDRWNEICDEIAQALDQAASEADADERPVVAQAQAALRDVRALATASGINEWSMAMNALEDEEERRAAAPAAFDGRGRLTLTAAAPDPAAALTPALHAALRLPAGNNPERVGALERVRNWLAADDPVARASAGLLLLEAGERAPEHVAAALDLLTSPHDLFRYRAYLALVREGDAHEWPLPAIDMLAWAALGAHRRAGAEDGSESASDEEYLRETYASWALDRIRHTRAGWIAGWIAQSDAGDRIGRRILGLIHRLADECWSPLLDGLRAAGSATQEAILDSLFWLLQGTPPDHPHLPAAVDTLLDLSAAPAPVGPAALRALGSARALSAEQAARLCRLAEQPDPPEALWATLARLSALPDADAINTALAAAPDTPALRAARVRQVVQRRLAAEQQDIPQAELAAIAPEPRDRLEALLAAGTDNRVWGDYHERIADAIRDLLTAHDDLLPALLVPLRAPLTDETWHSQRIALAALARCATVMPERFNELAARSDLVALLLAATAHPDSHNIRRFAITALTALREINAEVLAALFRLAGDTARVQDDVIAAAQRLNRLHPALGERLPEELVQALTGESAIRAYVAAQVLEALGVSAATMITPGLRRQIVALLAGALRDPRSRRSVWRWREDVWRWYGDDIKEDGTLDQHFYRALLRVAGFRVE